MEERKMFYLRKAIMENGEEHKSMESTNVYSKEDGRHLIVTWNRQGKIGGFPKWKYRLHKFNF